MRFARSHAGFYRALAGGSEQLHLIEALGVEAISAPARPSLPILNAVVAYDDPDALEDALPGLEREYARLGVSAWAVWMPEQDARGAALLGLAGFSPRWPVVRIAAPVWRADLERRLDLDFVPEPTWEMVARCNDRSYGLGAEQSTAVVLGSIEDPSFRLYAVRSGDEVVAGLASRDLDGDCYLCFVATVPEARGAGIGTELVRSALRDAVSRGCWSGCGESTPGAVPLYAAVGGRSLGAVQMWQRDV